MSFTLPVLAQDSDLYQHIDFEGKAFIRFFQDGEVTPYKPYTPKQAQNFFDQSGLDQTVVLGNFYTILQGKNQTVFIDQRSDNRTKAVIAFYNVSEKDGVSLKVGDQSVFDSIASLSSDSREINASKIAFDIYQGQNKIAQTEEVIIERQNHYSIIFNGESAKVVKATIDATL